MAFKLVTCRPYGCRLMPVRCGQRWLKAEHLGGIVRWDVEGGHKPPAFYAFEKCFECKQGARHARLVEKGPCKTPGCPRKTVDGVFCGYHILNSRVHTRSGYTAPEAPGPDLNARCENCGKTRGEANRWSAAANLCWSCLKKRDWEKRKAI